MNGAIMQSESLNRNQAAELLLSHIKNSISVRRALATYRFSASDFAKYNNTIIEKVLERFAEGCAATGEMGATCGEIRTQANLINLFEILLANFLKDFQRMKRIPSKKPSHF